MGSGDKACPTADRARDSSHGPRGSAAAGGTGWTDDRHYLSTQVAADLRAARLALGLSLREVADRAGTDFSYLSKLERGERCPSTVIAEALIGALALAEDLARRLRAEAQPHAGRSAKLAFKWTTPIRR